MPTCKAVYGTLPPLRSSKTMMAAFSSEWYFRVYSSSSHNLTAQDRMYRVPARRGWYRDKGSTQMRGNVEQMFKHLFRFFRKKQDALERD
jgi:hypothetical protein